MQRRSTTACCFPAGAGKTRDGFSGRSAGVEDATAKPDRRRAATVPAVSSLFPCCYSAVIPAVPPLFFNGKIDVKCNKDSGFGG
jgi:hypothetical protein